MPLVIALNIIFAAFVIIGIVGHLAWSVISAQPAPEPHLAEAGPVHEHNARMRARHAERARRRYAVETASA